MDLRCARWIPDVTSWLALGTLAASLGCAVAVAPAPTGSPSGGASNPLSCDELVDVADALDDWGDAYDASGSIPEGSNMDAELGDVVDALEEIARLENDAQLSANVRSMAAGYDSFNGPLFINSLDAVTARLDVLHRRDC